MMQSKSVRRSTGRACRTAVALGVKWKNSKAVGPENACPIVSVLGIGIHNRVGWDRNKDGTSKLSLR